MNCPLFLGGLFSLISIQSNAYTDTTSLFFKTNVWVLSNIQEQTIDSLIDEWKKNFPLRIDIIGYADFVGDSVDNYKLSLKRATAVKTQITRKVPGRFVEQCKGNGELPLLGDTAIINYHRRVDIIAYHQKKKTSTSIGKVEVLFNLDTISVGQQLKIPNLNFYPGRHIPLNSSQTTLARLLKTMHDNPNLKIEIHGHICCQSGKEDGIDAETGEAKLSENRAHFVYSYLAINGISTDRMTYKGFARRMPLIKNERTEADRIQNRRVEIKIIAK